MIPSKLSFIGKIAYIANRINQINASTLPLTGMMTYVTSRIH